MAPMKKRVSKKTRRFIDLMGYEKQTTTTAAEEEIKKNISMPLPDFTIIMDEILRLQKEFKEHNEKEILNGFTEVLRRVNQNYDKAMQRLDCNLGWHHDKDHRDRIPKMYEILTTQARTIDQLFSLLNKCEVSVTNLETEISSLKIKYEATTK